MFITPAFAQSAPAGDMGAAGIILQMVPFALIIGIMYLLVFRPQQKRMREHQALVSGVRRGDTVVTQGGMVGKVTKVVDDNEVLVEIAEGVRVRILKATLADVRAKGEPSPEPKGKSDSANDDKKND